MHLQKVSGIIVLPSGFSWLETPIWWLHARPDALQGMA
jgi:hypothetical protein